MKPTFRLALKVWPCQLAGAALDLIEGEEDIRLRIVTTDTNRLSCSEAKFNIESDKIALFKDLWQMTKTI